MKLSNKGRYGVRAVFDIAFHGDGAATQVKGISERQAIPPRFLEQIFQDLKRAGLVQSKRGPRGGYALAREADAVTIGDIVRALEGPVVLNNPNASATEDPVSHAVTETLFTQLAQRIEASFDAVTIQDLCDRAKAEDLRMQTPRRYVYSI